MVHGIRTSTAIPYLDRLMTFAEPSPADVCLDVSCGSGPFAAALAPRVRAMTAHTAGPRGDDLPRGRTPTVQFGRDTALPYRDDSFTLVTARFSLLRLGCPDRTLKEMLRVCRPGGRLIIADLVRPNLAGADRNRIEQLRDPAHPAVPSVARLVDLVTDAGADVRRLDVLTVERPLESWLADAPDAGGADRIRTALAEEFDGGPATGAKPRMIGGELWLTQSWAHLAAGLL